MLDRLTAESNRCTTPRVLRGLLHVAGQPPIVLDTPHWHTWLERNNAFVWEGDPCRFLAQRELRRARGYWYGYLRYKNRLHKVYLGVSNRLTRDHLAECAGRLLERSRAAENHTAKSETASTAAGSHIPLEKHTPERRTPVQRQSNGRRKSTGKATINPFPSTLRAPSSGASILGSPAGRIQAANSPALADGPSLLPLSRLEPPHLPEHLVVRPRLLQLFGKAVTVVCAPSGFGKSTLACEWRQSGGIPVAWASLDQEDDDPRRFWFIVGVALQRVDPRLGHALLTQLHSSLDSDVNRVALGFANQVIEMTQRNDAPRALGLVLDDYHHLEHPAIHASMQVLIDNLPSGLRLVIVSRTRLPLNLGHLRARARLAEIETDDLRFTLDEGSDYLQLFPLGRRLAFRDRHLLIQQTEGWAAGLHLMILARVRQENKPAETPPITGAHAFLSDYFAEAVLDDLSPEVQRFLFQTSVLRQLSGPLCDAVTGRKDSSQMLAHLWAENLFLQQLEQPDCYRYQDLFLEMLRAQLQVHHPELVTVLHRRAAQWFRTHAAPVDAIFHLLAIGDFEEAAGLMEEVALFELEHLGEDSRLLRWLHQLPAHIVQQHRTLLKAYVRLSSVSSPHSEVARFLSRVESNIIAKPRDQQTAHELEVLADIHRYRPRAASGSATVAGLMTDTETEPVWQLLGSLVQAQPFSCPSVIVAEARSHVAFETARAQGNLFAALIAGGGLAKAHYLQGHLRRSERAAQQTLNYALAQRGTLPEPSSVSLWTLSRVHYERNDLNRAQRFLALAMENDPNPASSNILCAMAVQQMKIEIAHGRHDAAQATIAAAQLLHVRRPSAVWSDAMLATYDAWRLLRIGDHEMAAWILHTAGGDEHAPLHLYVRGELELLQGNAAAAEECLTRLLQAWPHGFHLEPVWHARILLSLALVAQARTGEAVRLVVEALHKAVGEEMVQPFLLSGAQCAPLLQVALKTRYLSADARNFAKALMDRPLKGNARGFARDARLAPPLDAAALLTPREQEVLQLARAGMHNREMAAALYISESTVKTHLSAIYRKLGVRNRTQAVTQAP